MSAKTTDDEAGSRTTQTSGLASSANAIRGESEPSSSVFRSLGRSGLDLLFPPQCLCCLEQFESGQSRSKFCESCEAELAPNEGTKCPACGLLVTRSQVQDECCVFCRHKRFRFDRVLAYGKYTDPLRQLVIRMKQDAHETLTTEMGMMFAKYISDVWTETLPDVVTEVPVHWWRRVSRGTHVSRTLARCVATGLQMAPTIDVLTCRRRMRKQGTLLPDQRRRNVRGAFEASKPSAVQGKHVLVVDDVMTTGATLNEIAKVLKRQKATKVTVAIVARGVGDIDVAR